MAESENVVTDNMFLFLFQKYVMWGINGIVMKFWADFRMNWDSIAKNKNHY